MQLTVTKEAILDGLQKVQAIVQSKTPLPVLSNVLLKAEKNKLTMTTTDLGVSVKTSVEAEVSKTGATTLPARKMFSIIRELPNQEIEIEVDDTDVAVIKCGASVFKLMGKSEDEFPGLPKFDSCKEYTLHQGEFRQMLQQTAYGASTDETRYVLNGVLLSFKDDKLVVVATDGRRLALVEKEIEFSKDGEAEMILPSKTVNELVKTLNDEGDLLIKATDSQIAFEFNDMLVVSKLIEGTYPNYRQVIPAGSEHRVSIERELLLNAVRRVALMTSDQSNTIKLTFSKNNLEITTNTQELGEAKETISLKYDDKKVSIAFNPVYLMDPLRTLGADEVIFEFTDDLSPGVLKINVPFLYVLMPMRLN